WSPDCCILQWIDYNLLPRGIEKAPFPLIALLAAGDWDLDLVYSKIIAESADLVIGSGYFDEESLPFIGARNVEIFYLGTILDKYIAREPKKIKDREYDLFYTATWLSDVTHPERSKWVLKLTELAEKYNVLIAPRGSYSEYLSLLNESKLAFSHVRRGVFSNRVLEAAAQGSVAVVTGRDVKRYFEEGSEFISVDEDDFFERLEYYLKNEELLQDISDRAYAKVVNEFGSKARFIKILEIIEENLKSKQSAKNGKADSRPEFDRRITNGEVYFYAYFRSIAEAYFFTEKNTGRILQLSINEFKEAVGLNPTPRAKTGLAVASAALMFKQKDRETAAEKSREVIRLLQDTILQYPGYVLAYYNLGLFHMRLGSLEEAMKYFIEGVRLINDGTGNVDAWCLQNQDFELFKTMLQNPLNEHLLLLCKGHEDQVKEVEKLYHFAMWYFISALYEEKGDLHNSLKALLNAHDLQQDKALCIGKTAWLSALLGFKDRGLSMYQRAVEMLPFDIDLRVDYIRYLYLCGKDREAIDQINAVFKTCKKVKTMQDRLPEFKALMEDFGRFEPGGYSHDSCTEKLLNFYLETLYKCLKVNPCDIKLLSRTAEVCYELGCPDKVFGLLEEHCGKCGNPNGYSKDLYEQLEVKLKSTKGQLSDRINKLGALVNRL
ncbi:MAG: glycosyltransferase family 1 protein, partial [Nitrospirae bacterium]|nr:glycosyltransferase family 1 protein [Nitrospirota bacterium]